MALEYAILGFLEREPMTGYDLKTRCFDSAVGHVWRADQAQVYRTLDRLANAGMVKPKLVPQRGKPDRKLFRITPKGRAALADWLRRPQDPGPLRDPLLLHLTLSSGLGDEEIESMLARARTGYQDRLKELRGSLSTEGPAPSCVHDERQAALRDMTLLAAMSSARSAIDWIDDCVDRVRAGLPKGDAPGPGGDPA